MSDTNMGEANLTERRATSAGIAEKLVAERAEVLVLYCQTAGLEPFQKETDESLARKHLQEFCQLLMDYIAAGHFGLYERIANGNERRQSVAKLAEELFPRIAQTTEAAVAFNDKYDRSDDCDIDTTLGKDLSKLGEELALRAELEDQLLNAMAR
jgi:regulator of sigma D